MGDKTSTHPTKQMKTSDLLTFYQLCEEDPTLDALGNEDLSELKTKDFPELSFKQFLVLLVTWATNIGYPLHKVVAPEGKELLSHEAMELYFHWKDYHLSAS